VVEDNLANQMVVRCLLEPMGVEISIAGDGRQGVDQWNAGSFEAVLMDMQMPVMDGIAATREIRRLEAEQGRGRTPIVMLTANTTEAHHRLAEEAGCDGVLVKPIDLKTLVEGLGAGVARAQEVAASQACVEIA
jgi:CheY-like chemotaxis protein